MVHQRHNENYQDAFHRRVEEIKRVVSQKELQCRLNKLREKRRWMWKKDKIAEINEVVSVYQEALY